MWKFVNSYVRQIIGVICLYRICAHTFGMSCVHILKYLYGVSSIIRGYIHISIIFIGGQ